MGLLMPSSFLFLSTYLRFGSSALGYSDLGYTIFPQPLDVHDLEDNVLQTIALFKTQFSQCSPWISICDCAVDSSIATPWKPENQGVESFSRVQVSAAFLQLPTTSTGSAMDRLAAG